MVVIHILLGVVISFILLFVFSLCKVAHISDEEIMNVMNKSNNKELRR